MTYQAHQAGECIPFAKKIDFLFSSRAPSAAQRGQGTLIVESKDSRDNDMNDNNDDEDDNFLIQEEKPSVTKSFVRRELVRL